MSREQAPDKRSRLLFLTTDGTANSPWMKIPDEAMWWQIIGTPVGGGAQYNIQVRYNGTTYNTQTVALNAYRSDLFVGCPDLWVRINGAQNNTYLLAINCEG